jgi:hypothetical protein
MTRNITTTSPFINQNQWIFGSKTCLLDAVLGTKIQCEHKECDACHLQIHVPSERPGDIAMDPANAIAVPDFGVSGFREMHGRFAETVGLVRIRGMSN